MHLEKKEKNKTVSVQFLCFFYLLSLLAQTRFALCHFLYFSKYSRFSKGEKKNMFQFVKNLSVIFCVPGGCMSKKKQRKFSLARHENKFEAFIKRSPSLWTWMWKLNHFQI